MFCIGVDVEFADGRLIKELEFAFDGSNQGYPFCPTRGTNPQIRFYDVQAICMQFRGLDVWVTVSP